ncbi:MAG: YchJ family protein [Aquihabitans sp.]
MSRPALRADAPCPCGRPATYDACCGRIHRGDGPAATAEALMRSRYSAFAVGDMAYLARSWHPDTKPRAIHDDPARRWTRLDVIATTKGGMLDQEGTVEFEAHHTGGADDGPGDHVVHEVSTFTRVDDRWVYVGRLG